MRRAEIMGTKAADLDAVEFKREHSGSSGPNAWREEALAAFWALRARHAALRKSGAKDRFVRAYQDRMRAILP